MTKETAFTNLLLKWNNEKNDRCMPWKNEKNPYRIWISEIILQQTRVQQGIAYYNRFIERFPTINDLAAAEESEVFKLWEGLGYYSRCKNIILSARYIVNELQGHFPEIYEDLLKLKGVGTYTASAIASFAYNLPYAVVDGNVFRVLSRVFGIRFSVDSSEGKKNYSALAQRLLNKKMPGTYNQSLMDFGATICKPQSPLCTICPVNKICFALINKQVNQLPVKQKKVKRKLRWMFYLVINYKNKLYVRKRIKKDIWQNLFEFVLLEMSEQPKLTYLRSGELFTQIMSETKYSINSISGLQTQLLTHQSIKGRFISLSVQSPLPIEGYKLVTKKQLCSLPFPKFITTYLED